MKSSLIAIFLFVVLVISPLSYAQESSSGFEVSQKLMQVKMNFGENVSKGVKVLNRLSSQITLEAVLEGLNAFASISPISYTVEGHQEQDIKINLSPVLEGIFVGGLLVSDTKTKINVPIILEVESSKPTNAAKIEIPAEFRSVDAGKEIAMKLSVLSLDSSGEKTFSIKYQIIGFDGKIILSQDESATFNSTFSVVRRFTIPSDTPKGDYLISVVMREGSSVSTATRTFSVGAETSFAITADNMIYILMGLVVATVIVLYLNYGRLVKLEEKRPRKVKVTERVIREKTVRVRVEGHNPKVEEDRYKMRRQLDSLERAYKAGYISKPAYLKSKDSLERAYKQTGKRFKRG